MGIQLVADAGIAFLVLLVVTALGIFKPWGKTSFGRKSLHIPDADGTKAISEVLPFGLKLFLAAIGLLAAVFVLVHLSGGGLGMHHR